MTREEAREHFEWFVGISEARRDLLTRAYYATGGKGQLDHTPDSLVPLWVWTTPLMESRDPSPEELRAQISEGPEWIKKANISFAELTPSTKCLCMDIGFYLAQLYLQRYSQVQWALWRKKTGPYNRPILTGFRMQLVPCDLVAGCAWSAVKNRGDKHLLREKYHLWLGDLS